MITLCEPDPATPRSHSSCTAKVSRAPQRFLVHHNGFSGATVKHNDTESVDALQLAFGYTAPAYRAESGCVTAGPYTGVGRWSCSAGRDRGDPQPRRFRCWLRRAAYTAASVRRSKPSLCSTAET
ncbi:hypothetical protein GCM10027360_04600 [Amycolatopsis echigonensis]